MGGGDWRKGFAKSQPLCDVNQLNICPQRSVKGEVDMMIWASSDVNWIEIHSIWLLSFTAAFNVSKTEKQKTIALSYVEFVACLRLDLMHLLKVQTKYIWVSLTFFVGKHPNPPHPPLNDKSPRVCSESLSKSSVGLLSSKKEWTAFNKNTLFLV